MADLDGNEGRWPPFPPEEPGEDEIFDWEMSEEEHMMQEIDEDLAIMALLNRFAAARFPTIFGN